MWRKNRFFQSAPLAMPGVLFVVGVVLGDCMGTVGLWWLLLGAALVIVGICRRKPMLQSAALLLAMASLGGVRSSSVRQSHDRVAWPDGFVRYEAVVVSEVTEKPKTMAADIVTAQGGKKLKCYVAKDDRSRRLRIGDRLLLTSRIERNGDWRRGSFDYRRYQEVHGFAGRTYVRTADWQLLPHSDEGLTWLQRLRLAFLNYRHTLLERYRQMGAGDEEYAVVAAMTLGDKSAMSSELRDVYAVSGAYHVLALSGLHLGIIYMVLSLLVVNRRFRLLSQVLAVAAIWAFALLVGLPASVVRAALMISTYALLSAIGRQRMSVNALALAAIGILMVSPDSLFDVGFQMSFLAMLAILVLQPLFERVVQREWLLDRPVVRWLWGLTTVSLAAQVGVAPLVAYYFGRFSTYFLLTNLIVIPSATLILCLAPVALLLPVVGTVLFRVVGWLNAVLSFIAERLPYASIEGLRPSVLQTVLVYVIIVSTYLIIIRYDKSA